MHINFNLAVLSVWFDLYVFDIYIDVFDWRYDCQGNMLDWGKKKCHKSFEGNFMLKIFLLFFVLINFQLSGKHFSVLPCYFVKREDFGKTLNFEINFEFQGWPRWHCINFPQSDKQFWCSHNYNWLSDMIDKDDITSVNVKAWEDSL